MRNNFKVADDGFCVHIKPFVRQAARDRLSQEFLDFAKWKEENLINPEDG